MKKPGVFIFFIAILLLVRIASFFAQPDLTEDHILQMAMSQNFIEGHGFSIKYMNPQKEIFYNTHIQWPPLYPFLLALISFITANPLLSSFFIKIVALLFLVILWKRIFNLLIPFVLEEAYFYFISLLIISTSIFNIINTILVVALLILSLSIYFTFAYLLLDESKKLNLFLSSLFASLLFWTHYSYFLVAFYPAVVLLIIFYSGKDKTYLYSALSSFIISLTVTSGVLIYNYLTSGAINYMNNPDRWATGFFPEHLKMTNPFFVYAFFNKDYLPWNFFFFSKNYHYGLYLLFQIITLIMFFVIKALILKLRKTISISVDKTSHLFIPFFTIIVLTISFLLYFTLHYNELPRPDWTHIGDTRYMSAVYLSIIAIIIILIFVRTDYINKKIINGLRVVLISSIFISISINIYLIVSNWSKYSYNTDNNNFKHDPRADLQELYDNIKLESSEGNLPVFVNNDINVRSFLISLYAKAPAINSVAVKEIKQFPSNMVFFLLLPEEKFYTDQDYQLMDWAKRFNLENIAKVNSDITLFKVSN